MFNWAEGENKGQWMALINSKNEFRCPEWEWKGQIVIFFGKYSSAKTETLHETEENWLEFHFWKNTNKEVWCY